MSSVLHCNSRQLVCWWGGSTTSEMGKEKEPTVRLAQSAWNWRMEEKNGSFGLPVWDTGNFNPILEYLRSPLSFERSLSGKHIQTGQVSQLSAIKVLLPALRTGEKTQSSKNSTPLITYSDRKGEIPSNHKKALGLARPPPERSHPNCGREETFFPAQTGRKLNGLHFNLISVSLGASALLSASPRISCPKWNRSFSYFCWTRKIAGMQAGWREQGHVLSSKNSGLCSAYVVV